LDLWQPIPVGVDEAGDTVYLSLPEHNVLLGGEPGSGKSAALSLLVASAALDPSVKLWLLDGKLVELAPWATQIVRDYADFPQPVSELASGRVWDKSAVEAWAQLHADRRPGRPRKQDGQRGG
jgi:hypothetical protein